MQSNVLWQARLSEFFVPAATLYCGVFYKWLKEWSDVVNLALPSETNYYNVQAQFLFPHCE